MPRKTYFEQEKRIAGAKRLLLDAIYKSDERDISIWFAALAELLKRVSDWNLQAERGETPEGPTLSENGV